MVPVILDERCQGHVSPDCREGKHRACNGGHDSAWCYVRDATTRCACDCHEPDPNEVPL